MLFGPKTAAGGWGSGFNMVGGQAGQNGVSIDFRGSYEDLAAYEAKQTPVLNQAYYNKTDKKSYIYNGIGAYDNKNWQILAQDGAVGPAGSVIFRGTDTPPDATVADPAGSKLGDYFFATNTQTLYGPKTATDWTTGTVLGGTSGWSLIGNTGTNATTNFFGTADDQDAVFKANNIEGFRITSGVDNQGNAIPGYVDFKNPVLMHGQRMLWDGGNASLNNVLIGSTIPNAMTGFSNIVIGRLAGAAVTDGTQNVFLGVTSGLSTTKGAFNTFIGTNSGRLNVDGNSNIAMGYNAGPQTGSLSNTIAIGGYAQPVKSNTIILGGGGSANNPSFMDVGINIANPRAAFDINSKGAMIIPTGDNTTDKPAAIMGMLRFNSTNNELEYADKNAAWKNVSGGSGWSLSGNTGTAASAFIGTTDSKPVIFKSNGLEAFRMTAATSTMPGNLDLKSALQMNNQSILWDGGIPANKNILIGHTGSGLFNLTGSKNSFMGSGAGYSTSTGSDNTFIGAGSGVNNKTGSGNTAIGSGAGPDPANDDLTNTVAIGKNALVSASNSIVLGSSGIKVGINTPSPRATLDIAGTDAIIIPVGTTGGRPSATVPGMLRFNMTSDALEYADESFSWKSVGTGKILKTKAFASNKVLSTNINSSSSNYYYDYTISVPLCDGTGTATVNPDVNLSVGVVISFVRTVPGFVVVRVENTGPIGVDLIPGGANFHWKVTVIQ